MAAFEGYADPGFDKELEKLSERDRSLVLRTLRELAPGPAGHPDVRVVEGSAWPGTVRVRCGRFRVLALVLPTPRVLLFTALFRKKRAGDYDEAIRRHDARVAAQGPPLDGHLSTPRPTGHPRRNKR